MPRIYLDHNASTPIDPRLIPLIVKILQEDIGNPSSTHFDGRQSKAKLEEARSSVARFFGVSSHEVIFTSGGTEGAALLIRGVLDRLSGGEIISSKVEHACVYQTIQEYGKRGFNLIYPEVRHFGAVTAEQVEHAISDKTALIALMAVNNETGVVTDIEGIASVAHRHRIPFIVDGVAWLGKEKITLPKGVSGAFFSGHKVCAPKGVGFCICPRTTKLLPLFLGGEQELHRRAGTENLTGIVALAKALEFLKEDQVSQIAYMSSLRDLFEKELKNRFPHILINGEGRRICNTSNIAFPNKDGESLLIQLDLLGIEVSLGSACSAGAIEPSRVLQEMGYPLLRVRSSLRFSFGKTSTEEEVHRCVSALSALLT